MFVIPTGFPLGLEKWEGISQSRKSQRILDRLEKSGEIKQNTEKIRIFQINVICYFTDIYMNCVLFGEMDKVFSLQKKTKFKKYWENGKKYWKSQRILSVRKSENHVQKSTPRSRPKAPPQQFDLQPI